IRQNIYTVNGITVIADCYNASPESMNAALSVLENAKGRKVAVLGDMLELGTFAMGLHSSLGEKIRQCKTDVLLCYGDFAYTVCASFGGGSAFELEKREDFIEAVRAELKEGDTVLFKASNRLRFSELIDEVGLGKK
ncbi:MAG TPA: cyanophycin synthetase, partial [Bacillota bacterium]|nr:cyanophycin synthetase [Bacillota bacterium]